MSEGKTGQNYRAQAIDPLEQVRQRRLLINRCDVWLFDEIRPHLGRRVLEVGCGHGNLTQHLLDRDLVVATDFEPSSVEIVRNKFRDYHNVITYVYDICDKAVQTLAAHKIDTVVSLNVLEHVKDDALALSNMAGLLMPDGKLVLIVPAFEWLYGSMDASIGHFRRYTKASLSAKLAQAGFAVQQQHYTNALGALGWFVNGRVLKQQVPPVGQLGLFNTLVPLLATLENFIQPPIGISLISIATRKPSSPQPIETCDEGL
jgi:2-polyprenyl-3-methyl-5-hydroxy-6-metoxy-1,4-benzoquinol methylase